MAIENTNLAKEVPSATETVSAEDSVLDERVYEEIRAALVLSKKQVESSVNIAMVTAYWNIGKQISERIGQRAAYGKHLYRYLSERLTAEFGRGFGPSNLNRMRQFYEAFPIFATLSQRLSWSHYLQIMRVTNQQARLFYMHESGEENWSVRELKRAIDTRLFERLMHTQEAKALEGSADSERALTTLKSLGGYKDAETAELMAALKDPYVFEFLGIDRDQKVLESELESMLIESLHDFLLELGRGFAFVARQHRVSDESNDYYIDLVFYNYFIKCFVLIDLKTRSLTAGDVGQMDFYMNLFDDQCRVEGDNPTIGIVLCTSRNETVAKYSVLSRNENLFAAQYFPYLPTEEELETVLRRNRAEFEERIVRGLPEAKEDE